MPDTRLYTQEAAIALAAVVQTSLAASKLRLFKDGLTVSQYTTRADLLAAECDFDGYPAGGYALATWQAPLLYPAGGAVITAPMINVVWGPAGTPPVGNSVGGWWIEDSTHVVRLAGNYSPSRPLNVSGNGFSIVTQVVMAQNPTVSYSDT